MHKIIKSLEKEWSEKVSKTKRINNILYWNKRAEDYNNYIRNSDYEHGKKIKEVFEREGLLKRHFEVLDIAAGPGSVTIPFAEFVFRVVAVEPAMEMCKCLMNNLTERQIANIEIINKKWEDINVESYANRFDLVLCSHALWHFSDIVNQLMRMNRISRGYCCIAESVHDNSTFSNIYHKLDIKSQNLDHTFYLFNILHKINIKTNVKIIDVNMRRSIYSGKRMWELFLSKYRIVNEKDKNIIREHVEQNSKDGVYEIKSKMAILWWKRISNQN